MQFFIQIFHVFITHFVFATLKIYCKSTCHPLSLYKSSMYPVSMRLNSICHYLPQIPHRSILLESSLDDQTNLTHCNLHLRQIYFQTPTLKCTVPTIKHFLQFHHVVVVVDPTPPTCCQQSPAPESCGSQQSLPPGGKERLHFVGIHPEVQARKGGW